MNKVELFEIFEVAMLGKEPVGSHVDVDCSALFINGDRKVSIKGFYNGEGEYRIRFMPQELGIWQYEIHCSSVASINGEFVCVENKDGNHGPVVARDLHFQYSDGTKYIPFGTTAYAWTHQASELIESTKQSLSKSPFNKIRMCVFPKSMVYNSNDPERYPFAKTTEGNWDVHRPDFAFWTAFENQLRALMEMGIEADLILFHPYDRWGFASLNREDNLVYLDYCMRRLSSFRNIWWSLANEYDMVFQKTEEDWEAFGHFIKKEDRYHHLLSIHNWLSLYDFGKQWITHCSIQTSYAHRTEQWRYEFQKPVVIDECGYEGDIEEGWGNLSAFELVHRFWSVVLKGGFCTHGETYYRNDEVLWWSKGGELHGESVRRIAYLKEVVYGLEGSIQPMKGKFAVNPNDLQQLPDEPEIQNNPYVKAIMKLDLVEREYFTMNMVSYMGGYEDSCRIYYFGKSCQSLATLDLPEEVEYSIDLVDIWEMTRKTVISIASGSTKVQLPGKEGIAVIATRI